MFIWASTYDTGIEELDSVHKNILEIASGLFDGGMLVKDLVVIEKIIDKLLFYGKKHEELEQKLLLYYKYPNNCEAEFIRFHNSLKSFKQDLADKITDSISIQLLLFLKNWIICHLTIHTQNFKTYKSSSEKANSGVIAIEDTNLKKSIGSITNQYSS
ncbi:MAG: hypothetical protein JXR58_08425 [Bacteroidales bacterium]|nr:hypothetical protein [Bacteroidales bacterium]